MKWETGKRIVHEDALVPIAIRGPTAISANATDDVDIPELFDDQPDAGDTPKLTIRTKFPESWIWETLEEYVNPFDIASKAAVQ